MDGVYTGKTMTVAHGAVTLEQLRTVAVQDNAKPVAKMLDATAYNDSTYVEVEEPMGAEGTPKSTITVSGLDSATSATDTKGASIALNTHEDVVFTTASATDSNVATQNEGQLISRTTTISYEEPATYDMVFEANENLAWSKV